MSITSRATAHASGLPPNVEPCEPGSSMSITSRARDHRGDGHDATTERLPEQHHVGDDVVVVAGQRSARAAEAGLDLVGDEQHAVPVAHLADGREVARRRHDHARLALHRLEQHRRGGGVDGRFEGLDVAERDRAEPGREGAEAARACGSVENPMMVVVRPWKAVAR